MVRGLGVSELNVLPGEQWFDRDSQIRGFLKAIRNMLDILFCQVARFVAFMKIEILSNNCALVSK